MSQDLPSCNEACLYQHGVFKSVRVLLVWFLAALLLLRWNSLTIPLQEDTGVNKKVQLTADQHTIPSLLSVVDDTTGDYVNALTNPLYPMLKDAVFDNHEASFSWKNKPILGLDRLEIRVREPLTLTWSEQQTMDDDDILILFCGQDKDHLKLLDAATLSQARATHRKHGGKPSNNMWYFPSFSVLRQSVCQFSLYGKVGTTQPTVLQNWANSSLLHIREAQTTPTAIHLAYGDNRDEMVVQFKTGNVKGTPVVQYGSKNKKNHTVQGTSHTYKASDMCQEPATQEEAGKFLPPGQLHVVRLTGLDPDTTYWYRASLEPSEDDTTTPTVWSETYSFVSAPVPKADSEPFGILVYGDQGCPARGWGDGGLWTSGTAARELDDQLPIRAVHHFGDLSYAVGVAHMWDEWLNMISAFTTRVPLMVGVGNHEYDHTEGGFGKDPSGVDTPGGYHPSWGNFHNDSGGECGVPTANHFTMPQSKGSNGVFWWSHKLANVHTIMLSSEHDLSPGSIQYEWLKGNLEAVDRSITPWIILELHRPLYESEMAKWDYKVGVALRVALEDLLLKHQIDLVLGGHYHTYLRTCQGLYKNKCNNGGPLHITVGSAGAALTHNALFPNDWTEKYIQGIYGYGRITVANATAMHFEFVQAGSKDDPDAGRVLDQVWLTKRAKTSTAGQAFLKGVSKQKEARKL